MALDTERSVEMMQKSLRFFAEDMNKAEKASKGVAENVTQLSIQMQHGHRSFLDYVGSAIKLPGIFKEASMALVRQNEEIKSSVLRFKDQQASGKAMVDLLRNQIKTLKAAGADQTQLNALRSEKRIYESLVRESKAAVDLEEKRLKLKQSLEGITGKQLAVEFILIKGFIEAIKRSGQVNEALIQANSLTKTRNDLTRQIYEVQALTGASLQDMLGASKALTNVWPKARTDFKATLETVIKMEEGLGVSFETSSQLARIFQINLKTSVREIADQIAIIANSTSLAADEAARFATEVGKAVRLLGPGAAPGAKQVAGYVTMLSARMKDVGGDANEIIRLFTEMTKGTSQGCKLRGLTGSHSPGALGTGGGAQMAMQGIGKMIDRIVTAAPGTMAFSAQLEAAAQIFGTSTETILLYKQALQEANKPLDEHAKLQQRWQEQVANANKAFNRLRESMATLLHQALLPLIPPIAGLLGILARIVSAIASSRIAVVTATVIVGAAITKTIISLYRLSAAIIQVAAASEIASKFKSLSGAGGIGAESGTLGALTKIFGKPGTLMSALKKGLFTPIANLASPSTWGAMLRFGPLAAVAASATAGYAIGRLIDKKWPDNWIAQAARAYAKATTEASIQARITYSKPGERSVYAIMSDIRQAALRGNMNEALRIFEQGKFQVAGLETERGAKAYLNHFTKTMAEAREKIGLSTSTSDEASTLETDRRLIELTKKQVENSEDYVRRVREYDQRMTARQEADRAAAERQRMLDESEFRMGERPFIPRKQALSRQSYMLP